MAEIKLRNKADINESAEKTLYNLPANDGVVEGVNPGAKTGPNRTGKKDNVASVNIPGTNFQIKLTDNNTKTINATNSASGDFSFPFTALYFERGKLSPMVAVNDNGGGDTPSPVGPDAPFVPDVDPESGKVEEITINLAKLTPDVGSYDEETGEFSLNPDIIGTSESDPIYMNDNNELFMNA